MLLDEFISLRSWIVYVTSYFVIVFLLLCGIFVRVMEQNKILTKEQCGNILERYTYSKNFEIKSFSTNPLQSQLDGMIGDQYTLKIHYQKENEEHLAQFFVKIISDSNPVMFDIAKSIYAFEKESFYYHTVVPLMNSKGLDVAYVASSYFSKPYVIVLEDLSLRSFKGTLKSKPLDLQHCKKCLETLARFHADPIIYELVKSEELGSRYTFLDDFSGILEDKVISKEENGATKFLKCSFKGLFLLIDLLPENCVSKEDFRTVLQKVLHEMMSSQEKSSEFRCTLAHGDLWSNNFLFKYDLGGVIDECILIDFQTLKYGPPAMDVLQFIFTNTRKPFRDQHLKELLDHYYKCFSSLIIGTGFDIAEILSEKEFEKSCEVYIIPAKIISIVDRAITFMSDESHMEAAKSEEEFSKYFFEDRGKYMVSAFKDNEQFRNLMIEDITELRDMLFAGK